MKTAAVSGAVIAALAASALATPTFAQDYYGYRARESCHDAVQSRGTAGAVLGGVLGAVIGSNIAGHGARTGGTAIGAVAGALLGNSIGRSSAKSSDRCEQVADYGYNRSYGYQRGYSYDRGYSYQGAYGYDRSQGYPADAYRYRSDYRGPSYDRDGWRDR